MKIAFSTIERPIRTSSRPELPIMMIVPWAVLGGTTLVMLTALAVEHIGGYPPCALCLTQRLPYYASVALAFLAILLRPDRDARLTQLLMGCIAALCFVNAGLGIYHAGIEWEFWQGPATCSKVQDVVSDVKKLLDVVSDEVPSCKDAALRVYGVSMAGMSVIASAALTLLAGYGAMASISVNPR